MSYLPLTDREWALISDVLSYNMMTRGQPPVSERSCANAVLHSMAGPCKIDTLPQNRGYPSAATVRRRKQEWQRTGALKRAIDVLRGTGRRFAELAEEEESSPIATLFNGAENLRAMQACCMARLVSGLQADWRIDG